jgi:predicted phosphodiesterase
MDIGNFQDWGPYVSYGNDAGSEIRIAWKSNKLSHSRWLKFGLNPECTTLIKEPWTGPTNSHVVILKNLSPKTKYYYQISRDPDQIYSFSTGLSTTSKNAFSFNVFGDMHAYPSNNISHGFATALNLTPNHNFGVTVGDSINDGNDPTHWNAFFAMAKDYLIQKPLMNATGNHDTDNEDKYCRFLQAWPHPYVDPTKGAYYHMEYGNAVFIFIDSDNAGKWEPTPLDEQYDWLEETLQKYAKKEKWIFLIMHHQVYSTGDFSCHHAMHDVFRPLAQEYHIDAIFYGHDHHYEAYWVDRESDYGGTLFFVTGANGGHHHVDYNIMHDRDGKTKYIWPGRVLNVRKNGLPAPHPNISEHALGFRNDEVVGTCQLLGVLEPHFINVTINGDEAEFKAFGWQHQLFHHIKVKRAGTGRKFSNESELVVFGDH